MFFILYGRSLVLPGLPRFCGYCGSLLCSALSLHSHIKGSASVPASGIASFQHSGWVQLLGGIQDIWGEMSLRGIPFGAGGARDVGGELGQQG